MKESAITQSVPLEKNQDSYLNSACPIALEQWDRVFLEPALESYRDMPEERDSFIDSFGFIHEQAKMNSVLEPYRRGLSAEASSPALLLGATGEPGEPLGADINNYAPGSFSDDEITGLFAMREELQQRLYSGGGGRGFDFAKLKKINKMILESYIRALLGMPSATDYRPATNECDVECGICKESLAPEPSLKLPCGHLFHTDCVARWYITKGWILSTCLYCRREYRMPLHLCVANHLKQDSIHCILRTAFD